MSAPSACARAQAVRLAAAAALAALAGGCVLNPVRNFRTGVERAETGNAKVTTQTNLLEIGIQDRPAADFEYRLNDRLRYSTQSISVAGVDSELTSSQHRPSLDLALSSGPLRWSQLYQRQVDRFLFDPGPDNQLVRDDILQKLEWTPEDLPQVTAWVDFRTLQDDYSLEEDRVEAFFRVNQQIEPFGYDYSFRDLFVDDRVGGAETERYEQIGRATYNDTHLDDRLSTAVSVFIADRGTDIQTPLGTAATQQVIPLQTLSGIDLTPQISTLPPNPALNDGDLLTPAGVDIGGIASGGQLSWNLGAEILPGEQVDVVELATATALSPIYTGQFTFSVWASDDNVFWTLVQGSSAYVYDQAQVRFRISVPTLTRRYLKVVNTSSPAAAPAVLVTEVVLQRNSSSPGSSRIKSDDIVRNVTGNTAWRATDEVVVGLDLFGQTADASSGGTPTRDETRLDVGAWANWTPTETVESTVRVSNRRLQDPLQRDEDNVNILGVVSYRPLNTLDIDVSYTDALRQLDGDDDTHSRAAQVLASAQLLRKLRAEAGLERNLLDDSTNQREISHWILTAALIAEVTARWELTLRARNDNADVSGAGAAAIPSPSEDRYALTAVYRPSEQLIAEAQLEWIDGFAGQGLDQRLRLDWIPFVDGTLDVQLDVVRTQTTSFSDQRIDRYRALSRWSFNSNTYLELQFVGENSDVGPNTEIVSLQFAFRN